MKRYFSLLFLSILNAASHAQNVEWAINEQCNFSSTGNAVVSDSIGNSYVAGYFYTDLQIDTLTFTSSASFGNLFIAKYDPQGNIVWAEQAYADSTQGQYGTNAISVALDHSGNIYVSGGFLGNMTIGSVQLINTNTWGLGNMFVAKLKTSTGAVIWAEGIDGDGGANVAVDSKDNFYLSGWAGSNVNIGSFHLIANGSFYNHTYSFLAKFDSTGAVLWANETYSSEPVFNGGITVDKKDNPIITGEFLDSMQIGNVQIGPGGVFIAKFNSEGNLTWARSGDAYQNTLGANAIATDIDQAIYVAGSYYNTVSFGAITVNGGDGSFIVKYDSAGNVKWITTFGAGQLALENDNNNNLYLTCDFKDTLQIGSFSFVGNSNSLDILIAKFDSAGNVLWAESVGGTNWDQPWAIDASSNGNLFLTGMFSDGLTTIGQTDLTCNCWQDFFLAKFSNITGIPDINESFSKNLLYPNPASSFIQLHLPSSPTTLSIFNLLGEKVKEQKVTTQEVTMDVSELPAGMYVMKTEKETVGKFVKE